VPEVERNWDDFQLKPRRRTMSKLWLIIIIISSALTVLISVGSKVIADEKEWKNNLLMILGCILFLDLTAVWTITRRDNHQLRERAHAQEQSLEMKIVSLKDDNRALSDQIGDCNAQIAALRTKFHAPAHFKRGITESLNTRDSVAPQ
jgi:hypothetical protein